MRRASASARAALAPGFMSWAATPRRRRFKSYTAPPTRRRTNGIKTYSRTGIGALLTWVHSAYTHNAELLALFPLGLPPRQLHPVNSGRRRAQLSRPLIRSGPFSAIAPPLSHVSPDVPPTFAHDSISFNFKDEPCQPLSPPPRPTGRPGTLRCSPRQRMSSRITACASRTALTAQPDVESRPARSGSRGCASLSADSSCGGSGLVRDRGSPWYSKSWFSRNRPIRLSVAAGHGSQADLSCGGLM